VAVVAERLPAVRLTLRPADVTFGGVIENRASLATVKPQTPAVGAEVDLDGNEFAWRTTASSMCRVSRSQRSRSPELHPHRRSRDSTERR
jgi:hypothetical protein